MPPRTLAHMPIACLDELTRVGFRGPRGVRTLDHRRRSHLQDRTFYSQPWVNVAKRMAKKRSAAPTALFLSAQETCP